MKDNEADLFARFLEMQGGEAVEVQATHISYLFFQGKRVYKAKKTLKTDFLDYSSVALRHKHCVAELKLNRRLAPEIYLSVRAVYIDKRNELSWAEYGAACEWVVEMVRLPSNQMLDQLMSNARVGSADLAPLASLLSRFYQSQKVAIAAMDSFWMKLYQRCQDNFSALPTDDFSDEMIEKIQIIKAAQNSYLFTNYNVFMQRKGFIVDGHGDLRPEHICLTNPPVIFDCVEFSSAYRICDVLDELSFFKLECIVLRRQDLSDYLFKQIHELGNFPPSLLAFYLSYRAMIRVKVEAIKALQDNKSRLDVCQSYLRVGFNQALSIKQPILIVVGGLSGSGKTTVSSMIAQMLAGKHLQSDEIRTELFTKKDMGPVGFNKGRYLPERRDLVYRHLLRRAKRLLEKGYSVVLDASFIDLDHRGLIKTLLQDNPNLISSGIWCLCSDEVAIRRLIQRRMGQSSFSEADPDIYMHQKSALQKIDKDDVFRHRIDTDLDVKSLELKVFGMLRKQLSF